MPSQPRGISRVDRKTTTAMIGPMLGALGAKADKEALAGVIELIEGHEFARASELWRPLIKSRVIM